MLFQLQSLRRGQWRDQGHQKNHVDAVWTLLLEAMQQGKAMNDLDPRCSMHNGIIPMQENQIAQIQPQERLFPCW